MSKYISIELLTPLQTLSILATPEWVILKIAAVRPTPYSPMSVSEYSSKSEPKSTDSLRSSGDIPAPSSFIVNSQFLEEPPCKIVIVLAPASIELSISSPRAFLRSQSFFRRASLK